MASRSMRVLAVAVVGALALAACDSGSSGSSGGGSGSFDPATAAKALRRMGTIQIEGSGGRAGAPTSPVRGRTNSAAAVLRFPYVTSRQVAEPQVLRKGDTLWFRRTAGSGVVNLGLDLVVLSAPGKPAWFKAENKPPAATVVLPYEPAQLLAALADHDVQFERVSTSRGTAVRAEVPAFAPAANGSKKARQPVASTIGVKQVTVWVGREGVPTRMAVVTTSGTHSTYTVTRAGGTVSVVPPPEQSVELANRPTPSPTGPYSPVYTGSAGTVPFTILRAPGTDGWSCWKVASTPPYQSMAPTGADGGLCIPPTTTSGNSSDQIGFPIDALGSSGYELIAMSVPPGTTGEMILADGTTHRPLVLDATSGLALFAGPLSDIAGLMRLTLPDGTILNCGPGPVNAPSDLPPDQLQFGAVKATSLRDLPWNCVDTSFEG